MEASSNVALCVNTFFPYIEMAVTRILRRGTFSAKARGLLLYTVLLYKVVYVWIKTFRFELYFLTTRTNVGAPGMHV